MARVTAAGAGALVLLLTIVAASPARSPGTSCPARTRSVPASHRPGAKRSLVPPGAGSVVLCRYAGLNDPAHRAGRLVRSRVLARRAIVRALGHQLDRLHRLPKGAVSCPLDDGSEVAVIFRYPRGRDDPVTVELTGCQVVTNGHLIRTAATPGSKLIARLRSLIG